MSPIVDRNHIMWINNQIGKPWTLNGYGPDEYGCWGLTVVTQQRLFSRFLPEIKVIEQEEDTLASKLRMQARIIKAIAQEREQNWIDLQSPCHGCVVLMSRHNTPAHIGTYLDIDRGNVLHAHEQHGVMFEPISALRAAQWYDIKFVTHKEGFKA